MLLSNLWLIQMALVPLSSRPSPKSQLWVVTHPICLRLAFSSFCASRPHSSTISVDFSFSVSCKASSDLRVLLPGVLQSATSSLSSSCLMGSHSGPHLRHVALAWVPSFQASPFLQRIGDGRSGKSSGLRAPSSSACSSSFLKPHLPTSSCVVLLVFGNSPGTRI